MSDKQRYPNRLRELREKKLNANREPFSLREVAEEIGISHVAIARHETGDRQPDGFQIERYARYYGVTPYELFVPPGYYLVYEDDGTPVPSVEEDVCAIIERSGLANL